MQWLKKIKWLIVAFFAMAMVMAFLLWPLKQNRAVYFVRVNNIDLDLTGSRFVVDGYKVGSLNALLPPPNALYGINLEQQVRIPSNSVFYLKKDDQSRIFVEVRIKPSLTYLNPGDTLNDLQIDQDLPSAIVVSSQPEEKAAQYVATQKPEQIPERNDTLKKASSEKKEIQQVEYRLQIIASKIELPLDSPKFRGINNIQVFNEEGWFKYYLGPYSALKQAQLKQKEIRSIGFTDSFIVAYQNNKRISLTELSK